MSGAYARRGVQWERRGRPPITSTPPTLRPLIGASISTVPAREVQFVGYENAQIARCFISATSTLVGKTWTNVATLNRADQLGITTVCLSSKDTDPAGVRAFLMTKPPGITCYFAYHHEPENDAGTPGTATYIAWAEQWRNNWAAIGPAVRDAGCIPTSILMSWTLKPASGRDVTDWYPPAGAVDVFGFDSYMDDPDTPTIAVERVETAAADYATWAGIPVATCIGETGRLWSQGGESALASRATDMRALLMQRDQNAFRFACWWNDITEIPATPGNVDPAKDYRLAKTSTPTTISNAWWGV